MLARAVAKPFAEGTTVNSFTVDTISFAVLFAAQMLSLAVESKMAVVSVRVDTTNPGAVLADLPGYSDCSFTNFCCDLGQVGVFIYDGEGYLKVYSEQEPDASVRDDFTDSYGEVRMQPVMLSYNQDYAPRAIVPGAGFRVVGRVL